MPPVLTSVSALTKQGIADLYFGSLGNIDTRKNHVLLQPPGIAATASPPNAHDLEMDFTAWYGGVLALAHTIDSGVELPRTKEMCQFIAPQFERAKGAIAA